MRPYRGRIALAFVFLVMAAASTLLLPVALKSLIDQGLITADPGERLLALRGHFLALFGVGAALGLFSALRSPMLKLEPTTVCTRVVSVVRRLSTSPVCVVSKNSGLWRTTWA